MLIARRARYVDMAENGGVVVYEKGMKESSIFLGYVLCFSII